MSLQTNKKEIDVYINEIEMLNIVFRRYTFDRKKTIFFLFQSERVYYSYIISHSIYNIYDVAAIAFSFIVEILHFNIGAIIIFVCYNFPHCIPEIQMNRVSIDIKSTNVSI